MKRSSFEAGLDSYENVPEAIGDDVFDPFGVQEAHLVTELHARYRIREDHEVMRSLIHRYNDPRIDEFDRLEIEEAELGTQEAFQARDEIIKEDQEEEIFQSENDLRIDEFERFDIEELDIIPEEALLARDGVSKEETEVVDEIEEIEEEEEIIKRDPESSLEVKESFIQHVRKLKKHSRKKVQIDEVEEKWEEIKDLRVTDKNEQSFIRPPSTTLSPETSDENIFKAFLDSGFWIWLAEETNKYYRKERDMAKTIKNLEVHPQARITHFRETDAEEIKVFIGLYLFMGLSKKTETQGSL